jgi:hypothetical protein
MCDRQPQFLPDNAPATEIVRRLVGSKLYLA